MRRVFYRVVQGDTAADVARVVGVSSADLLERNHLDPRAALQAGMLLQVWIARDVHPEDVVLLEERDVDTVQAGTEAFFATFEGKKGRRRIEVTAGPGDTWVKLAQRYGVSLGLLERINQRSRRSSLHAGDRVVVYATRGPIGQGSPAAPSSQPDTAVGDDIDVDDDPYVDSSAADDDGAAEGPATDTAPTT
jgi:membrane-bound lytic murein transglycosylase D